MIDGDTPVWVVFDLARNELPTLPTVIAAIVGVLTIAAVLIWWQFLGKPRRDNTAPRRPCASEDGTYLLLPASDEQLLDLGDTAGVVVHRD